MTRMQKMFNKAVRAMRKQGVVCVNSNDECRYRGPKGLKCIAGHLIPDSLYNPEMEGRNIRGLIYDFPEIKHYFQIRYSVTKNTLNLLAYLQSAHDVYLKRDGMKGFEERIAEIAHKYGLTVPV